VKFTLEEKEAIKPLLFLLISFSKNKKSHRIKHTTDGMIWEGKNTTFHVKRGAKKTRTNQHGTTSIMSAD